MAAATMNTEQARFNMIQQQIRPWEVLDPGVLALLSVVKREDFVPAKYRELAFADVEIPLKSGATRGQTMLAPRVEARMLQELAVKNTDKVLEIGTGSGAAAIWMALALPSTGLLVTLERDHARATGARVAIAEAGVDDRVNVMIGEADRYLHKIAGPFDLILQDGDTALFAPMLDKLDRLLRPGGTLVTTGARTAPDGFAGRLAADPRFTTHWLPLGDGVAVSVKTS